MQIQELSKFHKSVWSENGKDKGKKKDRGNQPTFGQWDKLRENQVPQLLNYTPLNAARGKILDKALLAQLIPTLKQLQSPRNVDMSKNCQYHHNFDHMPRGVKH